MMHALQKLVTFPLVICKDIFSLFLSCSLRKPFHDNKSQSQSASRRGYTPGDEIEWLSTYAFTIIGDHYIRDVSFST